jgi:hypothetical protein
MAIDYAVASPVVINSTTCTGFQTATYDPGRNIFTAQADGAVPNLMAGVMSATPTISLSTLNCKEVLALLAATGPLPFLDLSALQLTGRKVAPNSPTFSGGTDSERVSFTDGVIAFTGLEASANDKAIMSLMAYGIAADGDTDPVTLAAVAAPSVPGSVAPYVLDSCTLDSLAIDEVLSVSVAADITWQVEHGAKPFPILVRPRSVDWSLTVRHNDPSLFRSKADKAATGSIVLKALATGGPTRGASTVNFSVVGLLIQGSRTDPATGNVEFVSIVRGANATPATWSVT